MVMYSLLFAVLGVVAAIAISGAISVAEDTEAGYSPIPVSGTVDGVGGFDELDGAWDVATAKMEGRTYAVVASIHLGPVRI